jgi:phospholipase/carboxylesterase
MMKKLLYDFQAGAVGSNKAMVAIHGWQGTRNSMRPLIKSININNMDWYLLEAPYPVKGSDGGFSWSYEKSEGVWEEDEPKELLQVFFNDLFTQYPSKNIYVMGFSQGGLVCLDFALFLDRPLGGVFPIAGFSRHPKVEVPRCHPCQKSTPIMIAHGKNDDQVPVRASENIYRQLKDQGANVELLIYNGKHKIVLKCLQKIKAIIQN